MAHHMAILSAEADTAAQHDTCLVTMQRERSVCHLQILPASACSNENTHQCTEVDNPNPNEEHVFFNNREQLDAHAMEKRAQISELQLAVAALQGEAAGEKS